MAARAGPAVRERDGAVPAGQRPRAQLSPVAADQEHRARSLHRAGELHPAVHQPAQEDNYNTSKSYQQNAEQSESTLFNKLSKK